MIVSRYENITLYFLTITLYIAFEAPENSVPASTINFLGVMGILARTPSNAAATSLVCFVFRGTA